MLSAGMQLNDYDRDNYWADSKTDYAQVTTLELKQILDSLGYSLGCITIRIP